MSVTKREIIPPEALLFAYKNGFFPMAEGKTGKINWYEPKMRAILPINEFHISKSLKQFYKRNIYNVTFDKCFDKVIGNCASRKETWISEEIIESYYNLFSIGYAHSVEAWQNNKLVGGLYGVAIGGAFFGESMFSKATNASKVALIVLVNHLKSKKYVLHDCQFITPHLKSLGAIEIAKDEYLSKLKVAINLKIKFN